ncbi:hypothetical protein [Engelhardtia mirabilis]
MLSPSSLLLLATLVPTTAQDCNMNGVDDAIDLVLGTSFDCNKNGVPDECDTCTGEITLIDFEGFPESTAINTQYAAAGVTFGLLGEVGAPIICTEGSPQVGFQGVGNDAPVAGLSALTDPNDGQYHPIEVLFDPPVSNVAMFAIDIDAGDVLEVRAYDSGSSLLASTGVADGDEGTGNGVGTYIQLIADGISRVEIEFTNQNPGFAIDDLSFERPSTTAGCNGLVRVAQESSPGAGDFDANILGYIEIFPTSSAVDSLYSYDFPASDSYNGTLLALDKNDTNLALIQTGDEGLALFVVHDVPGDGDGGRAEMRFDLTGDADGAALVLLDDPNQSDTFTGVAGESTFTARWNWSGCCTDGLVLGDLEGPWELVIAFTDVNGSSSTPVIQGVFDWILHSADGTDLELALVADRRVRLDTVAGPCPLSLAPDLVDISLGSGGTQVLSLDAGPSHAGAIYFLLGTITGTQPGLDLGQVTLPLNPDPYFNLTLVDPNGAFLSSQIGFLDGAGTATAGLTLPTGISGALAGLTVHHAFTLLSQPFVSNPCPVRLVP